jgi:hypothetical protein
MNKALQEHDILTTPYFLHRFNLTNQYSMVHSSITTKGSTIPHYPISTHQYVPREYHNRSELLGYIEKEGNDPQGTGGEPNNHDVEITSETGHQPPPRSQLCIRFRHRGLSRTGRAWIDRPLDLQRKGARTGGATGGDARSRGRGGGEIGKITLAWVLVLSARKESLMERTTSSGVDGRSRDAMRKKKDISRPRLGDFPCRLAGRQTAATGRDNAHCRQSMGPGRPRAVATPFSVSCAAIKLPILRFQISHFANLSLIILTS